MVRVRDAPKKPITIAEPKQMPTSCSTRSKVKRTLHSADGDSSGTGLQSYEPLLKRPTRIDAKQCVGSSSKISNDATQESSNSQGHEQSSRSRVIKRKSRSRRPPPAHKKTDTETSNENNCAEVALQNDIVVESLLSFMNRSDLLNARLVSKQWQYAGSKELRRRKFTIALLFDAYRKSLKTATDNICRVMSECQTPFFLLSSLHVQVNSGGVLGCSAIETIFNVVGNHLKNLTLFLDYSGKTTSFQRSPLVTHLKRLISLVPDLEFLEVHFIVPSRWKDQLQKFDVSAGNHQNDNKEFKLPKLKTFIVTGAVPEKFFADVVKAAGNLKSLAGDFSHDFSALVKYFMGPGGSSKIHLLKDLRLHHEHNAGWHAADFEIIQTFLQKFKNLELETFGISYKVFDSDFSTKIQNLINQILEENSGTLKTLMIQPLRNFKVIAIPRLPKLQEILFCFKRSSHDSTNFLPKWFDMSRRLPNVSSLVFLNCEVDKLDLYIYELQILRPVKSVRYILVKVDPMSMMGLRCSGFSPRRLSVAADFHHLFPNLVSVTYEHTSII